MIYCNQCGTKNADTGKFCKQCGAPIATEQRRITQRGASSSVKQKPRRQSKWIIFLIALALATAGVVAVGYKQGWFASVACGTMSVQADGITYGTVLAEDGRCWLDRNLGAKETATSPTDTDAYGWYFQWGRGADGHQLPASETTTAQSPADDPGHAKLILPTSSTGDWRNPSNNNLWQGEDGANNPCPAGFRVPTQPEWQELISKANITDSRSAFESKLKLTTGSHSRATSYSAESGVYWTSSPDKDDAKAYYLFLGKTSDGFMVNTVAATYRRSDFSVRCISDNGAAMLLEISDITALIRDGKSEDAKAALMAQYGTVAVDNTQLFDAWTEAKQYDVLGEILESRLEKVPDNIQIKVSLASAYANAGRKEEAIALLQSVKASNPEMVDQMDEFIQQVRSSANGADSTETNTEASEGQIDSSSADEAAKADREAQVEAGKSMNAYVQYMQEHYPERSQLPITARLYVIDAGKGTDNPDGTPRPALVIYLYESQENLQPYIEKDLKAHGFDLSKYDIEYVDKRY